MKVSIITVCYNSDEFIRTAIESVLNQTYDDIEYLIIDGGSKDTTVDIIKEYEPLFEGRLRWISERDKGLYDAMNKGIEMAKGDVIGLINSDDLFCDKYAIQKVVDVFVQDPSLDAVYADLYYVAQEDVNKIVRHWVNGSQRSFKKGWHPAHPTLYIKKEIYQKYGYFDLGFKLASDFEIMLRFLEKYKIKIQYLKDPLVKMRLGGATNKSLKNIINQNIECLKAFKKNELQVNSFIYPFYRMVPKLLQFIKK